MERFWVMHIRSTCKITRLILVANIVLVLRHNNHSMIKNRSWNTGEHLSNDQMHNIYHLNFTESIGFDVGNVDECNFRYALRINDFNCTKWLYRVQHGSTAKLWQIDASMEKVTMEWYSVMKRMEDLPYLAVIVLLMTIKLWLINASTTGRN